jgi:hypothetical protein
MRTYRCVVSLRRSAQNPIGTLTLGRLGRLKFPTSGAHSPDLSGIAKRWTSRSSVETRTAFSMSAAHHGIIAIRPYDLVIQVEASNDEALATYLRLSIGS